MNSIAQLAFKPVATEFAIRLHVSNGRFYGTAAFDLGFQAAGDAPPLAWTQYPDPFYNGTFVAFVHYHCVYGYLTESLRLR